MHKMIVAFSRPAKVKLSNCASSVIRWYQGGTSYSHVLFIFDDLIPGRSVVIQASHGKVHIVELQNFMKDNIITNSFFIGVDDRVYNRVIQYCVDNLQKPYGFFQLFEVILHKYLNVHFRSNGNKEFICSELIARALPEFFEASDLVTPLDIEKKLIELKEHGCAETVEKS